MNTTTNTAHLLDGKVAVIYGAAGGIGSGVARTFAREGATVVLAGRTEGRLTALAESINAELGPAGGGRAGAVVVDALDEASVDACADGIVERHGRLDISFNLISRGDRQGTPIVEMDAATFTRAISEGVTTQFLTGRAAARHMVPQRSGAILMVTSGSAAPNVAQPGMGNTGPADAAVDAFVRYLAAELGPAGVRVNGIWTAGVAETLTKEALEATGGPGMPPPEVIIEALGQRTMLRRPIHLADVAEAAAFLASDRAGGITGTVTNVTCGMVAG
jgi:NAD(P)-dependent dehydrogenase (short-subunit alcohol dehydrogenase family)